MAEKYLQNYLEAHGRNQYYSNLRTIIYRLDDIIEGTWKDVHSDKGKSFFFLMNTILLLISIAIGEKIPGLHPEQSR